MKCVGRPLERPAKLAARHATSAGNEQQLHCLLLRAVHVAPCDQAVNSTILFTEVDSMKQMNYIPRFDPVIFVRFVNGQPMLQRRMQIMLRCLPVRVH